MSWQEVALGDCFTIKHGWAFKSQYFGDSGEHIVLTPGNFYEPGGFRSRPGKDRFYTIEPPDDFVLRPGDLVIAMTEQGEGLLGSSALIPEDGSYLHNQRIGLIENLDERKLIKWFLYRLFNTPQVRGQIQATASGTKVRHTAPKRIYKIKVAIPPVSIQRKISDILSAYDDLIENNRRRIALLEEAARLLYREWFVHFRFPGHEHVKIIDGLPEGWEPRTLVELAEVVMGQSPKSQYYNEAGDGLPFHQGVTDYGFRFVSHRIYSTAVTKLAEAGDILVSVRAPVGRINITRDKIVLGRGLAAVRSRTEHQSFLLYALKNRFYSEDIIGTGAIYAATNKKELEGQILIEPHKVVLAEFEEQARDIDQIIENLTTQNEKLAQARNLLLPRLMNGEIAV
ncbi:MAG: restriction endonuclease subunit S [Bryobacterales bacterium]|nr:restriction endonuclease subunit S [Bryobacterales bacterium]